MSLKNFAIMDNQYRALLGYLWDICFEYLEWNN